MEQLKNEQIRISLIFLLMLAGFLIYVTRQLVSPVEMTIGVFNTFSLWVAISLLPVFIPLLTNNKVMKIVTLSLGGAIMLINVALPFLLITANDRNESIVWGISMILICGFSGLTGIFYTLRWMKEE